MRKGFYIVLILLVGASTYAQKGHKERIQGDRAYKDETFSDAELSYRKSLDKEWSDNGIYNLGNSLFEQKRYDEAAKKYGELLNENADLGIKADAWYNKGNAHFNQQNFGEALKSYIEALKLDPNDQDVKHNLLMAHKLLQQQQQQNQQQQDEEQGNQSQEENQEQQQQQDQEEQQQQEGEQDTQNQKEGEENEVQESGTMEEQQELSETEKQQLLQISEEEDKRVQEKMKRGDNKLKKPEKDW
jgi:tetratricopeptide (TPR) repeat protein